MKEMKQIRFSWNNVLFLNTVNARIDCEKQIVGLSFGDESHEFNFSKFSRKLYEK